MIDLELTWYFFSEKKSILAGISEKNDNAFPDRPIRRCWTFIPSKWQTINSYKNQKINMDTDGEPLPLLSATESTQCGVSLVAQR